MTGLFTRSRLAALIIVCVLLQPTHAAPPLPALGADLTGLTVSGVSSGGQMAVQFQVAHSRLVQGVGVIAGGPYYCAEGSIWQALTSCMSPSSWAPLPAAEELRARAETVARSGRIDPLAGLRDDRVWLFSGGQDTVVKPPVMDSLAAFYSSWLPPEAIQYVKRADAAHAMISVADPQANACGSSQTPYINRCGDFDAAGQLLAHLLGPLQAPATAGGDTVSFDQQPFVTGKAIDASLADEAYLHVPHVCRQVACRIHVVFHGCRQSTAQIGRRFVDRAGYKRWANSNRLLILYPQTTPRHGPGWGSWTWINNPFGCWDWWGYSGPDYHTRDGAQIKAVRAMLERLAAPREPFSQPAGDRGSDNGARRQDERPRILP